jgi:hypothetical protein
MTDLRFTVIDIVPEPYAVTPNLLARLRIEETTGTGSGTVVHAIALRAQVRIEPQRRRYDDLEEQGLLDLFGHRERWADTLRPFCWLHTSTMVQGFTGATEASLVLPCSYDVEVAGSKYLQALASGDSDGEVPLNLLFSGTVFTRGSTGFGVEQIPWHTETDHRLPVRVWRDLMDEYFPGQGWLRLDRETLAALARYRSAHMHTSWEESLAALLTGSRTVAAAPVPRGDSWEAAR